MENVLKSMTIGQNWAVIPHFKKVINGKMYDTETANCLAISRYHPDYIEFIALFKKRTGEFFSYKTFFSSFEKNSKYFLTEKKIEPLKEEEAKKVAEIYTDGDKYEEIFGKVEE